MRGETLIPFPSPSHLSQIRGRHSQDSGAGASTGFYSDTDERLNYVNLTVREYRDIEARVLRPGSHARSI
jgi:hypothetical protein